MRTYKLTYIVFSWFEERNCLAPPTIKKSNYSDETFYSNNNNCYSFLSFSFILHTYYSLQYKHTICMFALMYIHKYTIYT